MNTVKSHLAPLLNTSHESVQDVDQELKYVARVLCDTGEKTLPLIQPRKPRRWKDDTLTALCAQSRSACRAWKDADCPSEGPLFEEKSRLHRAVRRRVRFCAAKAERMRIQRRDKKFVAGARSRFRLPGRKKNRCSKLIVDGEVISSPQSLMQVWAQYFSNLAKSKVDESPGLQELQQTVDALAMQSLGMEDHLLDASFTAEEVGFAIRKLKRRKAPGPDKLTAEHLIEGGDVVITWLTGILNAVIDLESVPDSLKQ